MANYQNIRVEAAPSGVTRVIIDRPKVLNALNAATLNELRTALNSLESTTRVVVIAGGGEKAFVAGADIAAMAKLSPVEARDFSRLGHDVLQILEHLPQPTIAQVQGYALGGGCELLLACDFAIASTKAKIGLPEVSIGVMPGFGGTIRLARRVGPGAARQMMFTAKPMDAEASMRLGLVNEVVEPDQLAARVDAIAADIVKNAPHAVAFAKQAARLAEETDLNSAAAYEQEVFGMCFSTADQKEGMQAFLEKRKPNWQG
ncbi:MAG: enoyl-CoA hydratase-related protein [Myxococcota bacterium]